MKQINGLFFYPPLEQNFWGHILEEVYKTGLFEPFNQHKKPGSVVIDLGANVGLTAHYFSSRFEKVYAIEPAQEHMEVLKYMVDFNKIDNIYPFQFALSMLDKPKEKFYHYNNKTMNSLYGNIQGPNLSITGTEDVELKRLDTFIKEQKIEHVDLLKVDVEGVEFEILCGDSFANVADKIDNVVVEIHAYSQRNPNQIIDALKNCGYEVRQIPHDAILLQATKIK